MNNRKTLKERRENAKVLLMQRLPLLIISFVMLVLSTCAALKISWVGLQLWGISLDITLINQDTEVHHWPQGVQEAYEEDIAKRNALINSADDLTSFIARHSNLVRLPVWLAAVAMQLLSIWAVWFLLPKVVRPAVFLHRTRNR